jgi:hypothetical protein
VLEQCCKHLQRLALLRPLIVFVERLPTVEYQQYLPRVAAAADEVLRLDEMPAPGDVQLSFFGGG